MKEPPISNDITIVAKHKKNLNGNTYRYIGYLLKSRIDLLVRIILFDDDGQSKLHKRCS